MALDMLTENLLTDKYLVYTLLKQIVKQSINRLLAQMTVIGQVYVDQILHQPTVFWPNVCLCQLFTRWPFSLINQTMASTVKVLRS